MNALMIQTIPAHIATLTATAAQIERAIGQRFWTGRGAACASCIGALSTAGWDWGTM